MPPTVSPVENAAPLFEFAQGGLIDDADLSIADAQFTEWDYNGQQDKVLALGIQFIDDEGHEYEQYYSAGKLTFFVPSPDGSYAMRVGDRQKLNDSTNASKFLMSLIQAGFPAERMGYDVHSIIGTKVHVLRQAQPKRKGLVRREDQDPDKEQSTLLVSAILAMPEDNQMPVAQAKTPATPPAGQPGKPVAARPAATGKPAIGKPAAAATTKAAVAGKANGAAAAATAANDGHKAIATEMLSEILVEHDGTVDKKQLSPLGFAKATAKVAEGNLNAKDKTAVVQLMYKDSFLHELVEAGTIVYADGVVSLATAA